MISTKYYSCECYLYKNYFLEKFNVHVEFYGGERLSEEVEQILLQLNATNKDLTDALVSLQTERKRRGNVASESLNRKILIHQKYSPLHPHLYQLQEKCFQPEFLSLVQYATSPDATYKGLLSRVEKTKCESVWRFPVFTHEFCDELLEELDHFQRSDLPKGRPNTMNRYGVLFNELGFDEGFLDVFRQKYLSPLSKLLLPRCYGEGLDSHKAFTVTYKEHQDVELSYHFDNAEVSINICLGKVFEDGELYFGGLNTEPDTGLKIQVKHEKGTGVLHRGRQMHGTMPITGEGAERHNLIMWMRSSSIRNKQCPMCGLPPTLIEQPYGGDGFSISNTCSVV